MMRAYFPHIATQDLADRLRRTSSSIDGRAHKLDLHKTEEYRIWMLRECGKKVVTNERSIAARFQKGLVPANKGLRHPGWHAGRMRETQFRKGQQPTNTMPMWSFRFVDGYLMLKTGAPTPKPTTGWEYVHKLIWEHWNGPLPHWREARLWWKDGDHGNCSLSNLELVKGAEHVARTTVHNLPKPLVEVIQLAGALKRKIRNKEKKLNAQEHVAGSARPSVRGAGIAV